MSNQINMKGTSPQMFLFFSDLLGCSVLDAQGQTVGKLVDMTATLGELFPKVTTVKIHFKKRKDSLTIDWSEVDGINGNTMILRQRTEHSQKPPDLDDEEILLSEELLDKQVVDTYGAKIERVNDIHLLNVNCELRIVHMDFGIRGIFRRLGWLNTIDILTDWLFAYRISERMISWKYVQPLASDPQKKDLKLNITSRKLHELHPSDLADIIEELDREKRTMVFQSLDSQTAAEILEEVDPKLQALLIESAGKEQASDIIEEMAPDEAADLLGDLSEEKKQMLIQTIEKPHREILEELIRFKEGTAGSIMTKDFVSLQQHQTFGEAIGELKNTERPLETIAYLYVTDAENRLLGVLTFRQILLYPLETPLSEVMDTHIIKVEPDEDVEEVVDLFQKYKFLALPVVDRDNRLTGIITLRDAVESTKEFQS
jgi:magnesium transporter